MVKDKSKNRRKQITKRHMKSKKEKLQLQHSIHQQLKAPTPTLHTTSSIDPTFSQLLKSNPNPKHCGNGFTDRQHILIIGDGDFSFSLALAVSLGGENIVATSLDTYEELDDKYDSSSTNLKSLAKTGATTYHGVDGTALHQTPELLQNRLKPFHKIVFNFPHVGGATEADVEKNQQLLRGFFASCVPLLHTERGFVNMSLRSTSFYDSWNIVEQAEASGLKFAKVEKFQSEAYGGYTCQRTHPAAREPPSTDGAKMYFFKVDPSRKRKLEQPENPTIVTGRKRQRPVEPQEASNLHCTVCNITLKDQKKYDRHMASPKHARKVNRAQKKTSKL